MKIEIGSNKRLGCDWFLVGCVKPYDYECKWGEEPLPFKDNSIEHVYASHVLEHIYWYKIDDALKEVYRVLKPKGIFEVHVPDFKVIVKAFLEKNMPDNWRRYNKSGDFMKWVNGRLFAYNKEGHGDLYSHKACFDEAYLTQCLKSAGFKNVKLGAKVRGAHHGIVNLGMTAIK